MTLAPPNAPPNATPDATLAAALLAWFGQHARPLPWRGLPAGQRDPYQVLVSEIMLQQTQVSRVTERFGQFVARFPTFAALAEASEGDVLGLWAGLGYYRRARLLHRAAQAVLQQHDGHMPRTLDAIRALPGVGRYTAGAIASIGFGLPEPLVDGNVSRVLLRLEGRPLASDDPKATTLAWSRAGELVKAASSPGGFNEALMELGATVCTPMNPRCGACPWAHACVARREGTMGEIPKPKARVARESLRLECVVLRDNTGRVLLEQRPVGGLWGGLWQPPSTPSVGRARPTGAVLLERLGLPPSIELTPAGTVRRTLTHRNVVMRVWAGRASGEMKGREWFAQAKLPAMSSAHLRVLEFGTE